MALQYDLNTVLFLFPSSVFDQAGNPVTSQNCQKCETIGGVCMLADTFL